MTLLVIGMSVPDKATLVLSNAYALQVLINLYSGFLSSGRFGSASTCISI
jgi:hypothetical protein